MLVSHELKSEFRQLKYGKLMFLYIPFIVIR